MGVTEALHPSYVELHTQSQWKPGYPALKALPYLTDKAEETCGAETFGAESNERR
jgi:hypothetical protein